MYEWTNEWRPEALKIKSNQMLSINDDKLNVEMIITNLQKLVYRCIDIKSKETTMTTVFIAEKHTVPILVYLDVLYMLTDFRGNEIRLCEMWCD